MVAYSQPNDVRDVLAPGTFETGSDQPITRTAADLTDDQLVNAISQADRMIDGYIGGRYITPVNPTADAVIPEPIVTWSANVASYLATLTYRRNKDLSQLDPVYLRYQLTMSQLMAVNSGKITLNLPINEAAGAVSGVGQVVNPYSGSLFSSSDLDLRPVSSTWPYHSDYPSTIPGVW